MTPDEARETVDVIAYTLVSIERLRAGLRVNASLSVTQRNALVDDVESSLFSIGAELESLVQAGHVAELAGLGAAVERWRR